MTLLWHVSESPPSSLGFWKAVLTLKSSAHFFHHFYLLFLLVVLLLLLHSGGILFFSHSFNLSVICHRSVACSAFPARPAVICEGCRAPDRDHLTDGFIFTRQCLGFTPSLMDSSFVLFLFALSFVSSPRRRWRYEMQTDARRHL